MTKESAGTLVLNNPNSYTGGVTVNGGTLAVEGSGRNHLAPGSVVTVNNGGNVTWDAGGTSQLVLDTQGGDVTVGTDFAGLGFEILATGGGSVTLSGDVSGVTISDDGATTVNLGPGAATSITDVQLATSPGTTSGIKTTLTFTADGLVDIYASETLDAWGAPIATTVAGGTYVADDQSAAKRFYVIVSAGETFPPLPVIISSLTGPGGSGQGRSSRKQARSPGCRAGRAFVRAVDSCE